MSEFYRALAYFVIIVWCSYLGETKDLCQYTNADECNSSSCGLHINKSCGGLLCSCQYLAQPLEKEFLTSLVYGGRPYQKECDKNPPLFQGASTSKLGTVKLEVYKFKGKFNRRWEKSAFNITFMDVKWTTAHIRFQNLYNESKDQNLFHKNFTRRKEDNVTNFFYDCFWNVNHQKDLVRFQYEARDDQIVEVREFRFDIPADNEVETKPFMYVDVTDYNVLTLWLQGHSPQTYSVELLQEGNPVSKGLVTGHSSNYLLSYSSPPLWSGIFSFRVQILGSNETYMPKPSIEVVTNNVINYTAGALLVILIVSFLLFCYCWRKKPKSNPTMLITYTASSNHHVKVVKTLTKYLQDHCNTTVYLDDVDIPNSNTQDPLLWYVRAFAAVKYVVVISSPPRCLCSGSAGVTYRNMDVVALYLIRDCIERGLKMPKIFCVTLPYSFNLPTEVSLFHKFHLLNEMDSMLKFLHGASCLQIHVPGGKKDLAKYGKALSNAIKEAQQNSSCVCGGQQEVNTENHTELLSRLEVHLEDGLLLEYNVNDDKPAISNIPFPNVVKSLNLSGKTYTGMPRNERVEKQQLNIHRLKL